MVWYYTRDGQPAGPISEAEFAALVKAGTIGEETLIWREGLDGWVCHGKLAAAEARSLGQTHRARCHKCGELFPSGDLICLEGYQICAECKPVVVQRLREGVSLALMGSAWRHGQQLVVLQGKALPQRCIKCNGPTYGFQLMRILSYHHPLYYLILLPMPCLTILLYALVVSFVRRWAALHIGLCPEHRAQRRRHMIFAAASFAGMFLASIVALFSAHLIWFAFAFFFLCLAVYWGMKARQVRVRKMDQQFIFLSGAGMPFLATLPKFWPDGRGL